MSRYFSYLNSAKEIIATYKGEEPFAIFLKQFFAANKKFGSKDRKQVAHLCYCYFRLGKSLQTLPIEDRIIAGLFLCSTEPNAIIDTVKPEWKEKVTLPFAEKCSIVNNEFSVAEVFPWTNELSGGIESEQFIQSFFVQPDLFLRLRPGKEETVKQKLTQGGISFELVSDFCLALSNTIKVDAVIDINKEAVIQDQSSQQTMDLFLDHYNKDNNQKLKVWDCCAASGGKSILLYDLFQGNIELTVSDIRKSIIANLEKRFESAGIKQYKSFVTDLTKDPKRSDLPVYDLIIADVPCTGSGTWSRTPEQLYYFEPSMIDEYSVLQRNIVANVASQFAAGAYLLYITCSVFKKENEEAVQFCKDNLDLELIEMSTIKGYDKKADTMFVALLKKPL
ncbi:MAG TPA: Fmu (Sun) domain-containing protein [Chitinophagaceae bacterium]|nr:Fmu (Sun) domain-containing protein [Chitinophagaceae bacterium]